LICDFVPVNKLTNLFGKIPDLAKTRWMDCKELVLLIPSQR